MDVANAVNNNLRPVILAYYMLREYKWSIIALAGIYWVTDIWITNMFEKTIIPLNRHSLCDDIDK